jgi:putative transport protein
MVLLQNHIFLLILIIALGELLGKVNIRNLALGPSAIIFVALAFGHFGFILPEGIQDIGLAMFIYAVGLQAGPGFISSFRSHGLPMGVGVLVMAAIGTAATFACCRFFGFDAGIGAGLLSGAMTSTPSLAVAVETVGHGSAPAAYGVTYGFGVIGVAVFIKVLPRLMRVDISTEAMLISRFVSELSRMCAPPLVRSGLTNRKVS